MVRVAQDLRRIERGQVRAVRVMLALKRGPGGIDNKRRQREEDEQRLPPPQVTPRRPPKPANARQTHRRRNHPQLPPWMEKVQTLNIPAGEAQCNWRAASIV